MVASLAAEVQVFNAFWRVSLPEGDVNRVAHRGVYQGFDHTGIEADAPEVPAGYSGSVLTTNIRRIAPLLHDR